ncbi:biotin carboxylase N-terminal domain-containing protein [Actinotalea sp. K2]|uniref:acetyl/propionyl/methylcrotonyl-CoA carboxylase subunit alpha n=1 Tax=Actinotalea sp. K2 TaxID=2939438 RepID=UPI0020175199|nr:biotin carboxylase N-terminal domain-containing protein [Actinotalea sp. K2]MCL3862358.1 ATP-grasp domain-containing protein [Actinotalea sp. K2]
MTSTPSPVRLQTVLVANRGEIACRVIRTLQRMGIRSVAVHSDADRGAKHVTMADTAVRLGDAGSDPGYLDVEAVIAAARRTGAQAVHPGYGFLSESTDLVRACTDAGLVFVGPGIAALEIMGDKIRAKAHVQRSGVPVIPGVAEPGLSDEQLVLAAHEVGHPLLVKPSAGGGGIGMQVVEHPDDLPQALLTARRVARSAFADDSLLLERHLPSPRHIEVQVLADAHGSVIHLGERECSLQRRHQKVVEEAPSPLLDPDTRRRLGEQACAVARSVGYLGVGTVEMLVSNDSPSDFFFLEMNTRLQVEHPVTELVTGIDLVEWQLRVAAGEALTFGQEDVEMTGHAVEARVYAEDPARGFLPTTGTVLLLEEPTGEGVRVDSGLLPGQVLTPSYDPLLAKVIAWGHDRDQALARLDTALASTSVLGVHTNIAFLRRLLAEPRVRSGELDTDLLQRCLPGLDLPAPDRTDLVTAALWACATSQPPHGRRGPTDPWRVDGWRLGDDRPTHVEVSTGAGANLDVSVLGPPGTATVTVGDSAPVRAHLDRCGPDVAVVEVDGITRRVRVATEGDRTWIGHDGSAFELRIRGRADRLAEELSLITRPEGAADPEVRSPMPGTVVAVHVVTGDHVTSGQPLLTVEAMKMEHRLAATTGGVVTLTARPADRVRFDEVVATITPHPHEGTPP